MLASASLELALLNQALHTQEDEAEGQAHKGHRAHGERGAGDEAELAGELGHLHWGYAGDNDLGTLLGRRQGSSPAGELGAESDGPGNYCSL